MRDLLRGILRMQTWPTTIVKFGIESTYVSLNHCYVIAHMARYAPPPGAFASGGDVATAAAAAAPASIAC